MSIARLMLFMKPAGLSESRGTYVYHCDVTGSRKCEALCPATLFPERLVGLMAALTNANRTFERVAAPNV